MRRLLLVAVALLVAGGSAYALTRGTRPDPAVQSRADGCPTSLADQYQRRAPTWAYVNDRDAPAAGPPPPPQWAKGVVSSAVDSFRGTHPSGGDDPISHDSYDFNVNVKVDPEYAFIVGGREAEKTGNFGGAGEETGRLHMERETLTTPAFAWAEDGDRVEALGSWVWDCGHGLDSEQRTELHPIRALWVARHGASPRSPTGEAEGDLFVTNDATPAGVHAECAHRTKGNQDAFKTCLTASPRTLDVSGTYRFVLAAPPRPAGSGPLRARLVDAGSAGTQRPTVTVAGTTATVELTLAKTDARQVVAWEVFLGWSKVPRAALPQHLRVRFTSVLIRRAMDPGCPPNSTGCASVESTRDGQISSSPGEWNLYYDVHGIWGLWQPVVMLVRDGQVVPAHQIVDVYVPRGTPWRVKTFGRECDFGSLAFSDQRRALYPCPSTGEAGNPISDDVPGFAYADFRSPEAGLGAHRIDPVATDSTCPPSNAHGCYQVRFTVTRAR